MESDQEFRGRVALVTGGSRGIGKAICREFAARGATIVFTYARNEEAAKRTWAELLSFKVAVDCIRQDVSESMGMLDALRSIQGKHGAIDILVNNAGIALDKTLGQLSADDWRRVVDVNLGGCFTCSKAAVGWMRERGYGRIVNISSVIGQKGNIGQTNYAASKSAILGFTKALALETAKYDITVNAVCPGFIETEMLASIPEKIKDHLIGGIPKRRFGLPEEVARVVSFLASPSSGYITGQEININGGLHM